MAYPALLQHPRNERAFMFHGMRDHQQNQQTKTDSKRMDACRSCCNPEDASVQ